MDQVPESDYSVTVGDLPCTELDVSEDGEAITCLPPQSGSTIGLDNVPVTVSTACLLVNTYIRMCIPTYVLSTQHLCIRVYTGVSSIVDSRDTLCS